MRFFLFIFSLFLGFPLLPAQDFLKSEQGQPLRYSFRISPQEAQQLLEGGQPRGLAWLSQPVDSITFRKILPNNPQPGYYLDTHLNSSEMNWELSMVPAFHVIPEDQGEYFAFKVYDLAGNSISHAEVLVDKKAAVLWDGKTGMYRKLLGKGEHTISIEVDGFVQYYQVESQVINAQRGKSRLLRRFVVLPVYWTLRLPYDIVMSCIRGRVQGLPRIVFYRINRLFSPRNRDRFQGFLLTDKPKYRPGDTVQVKMSLWKGNRPAKGKMELYIYNNGRTIPLGAMRQAIPGVYTLKFALHDSMNLKLDSEVALSSYSTRGKRASMMQSSFWLEHYELEKYTFEARAESPKTWAGKNQVIYLKAKDANGLNVLDARAKVCVLLGQVNRIEGAYMLAKDTLWEWAGALDPSGETRLELPSSIFPAGDFGYQVNANVWNSDNETRESKIDLGHVHNFPEIKFEPSADTVWIRYWQAGQSIPTNARLEWKDENGAVVGQKWVTLPYPFIPSPQTSFIGVVSDSLYGAYNLGSTFSKANVLGKHTGDSIHIAAHLVQGSEFHYTLLENGNLFKEGNTRSLKLDARAIRSATYELRMDWHQAGVPKHSIQQFSWRNKVLSIDVALPDKVYPGMETELGVRVTNARGKAVKHADLTAYSINGQFGKAHAPNLQDYSRWPKALQPFKTYTWTGLTTKSSNFAFDFEEYQARFRLDTNLWYQFAYPDSGIFNYSLPIEAEACEFAPFVFSKGEVQPIQIIYVDGVPVYFSWASPKPPYSFPIPPGKHNIVLRTVSKEIIVPDFVAQKGLKTIFSLDVDAQLRMQETTLASSVHKKKKGEKKQPVSVSDLLPPKKLVKVAHKPAKLDPNELGLVSRYSLFYRGTSDPFAFVTDANGHVFRLGNRWNGDAVGPLDGQGFKMTSPGLYSHDLILETGFEYEFGPKVVKMRSAGNYASYIAFQSGAPDIQLDARAWTVAGIMADWQMSKKQQEKPWVQTELMDESLPNGKFELLDFRWGLDRIYFLDEKDNKGYLVKYSGNQDMKVPEGKYDLLLVNSSGQYWEWKQLEIKAGRTVYLKAPAGRIPMLDSVFVKNSVRLRKCGFVPHSEWLLMQPPSTSKDNFSTALRNISGVVVDSRKGKPVPDCKVEAQGSGFGGLTDLDGRFAFRAPADAQWLRITLEGYRELICKYNGQQMVRIELEAEEDYTIISKYDKASRSMSVSEVTIITDGRNYRSRDREKVLNSVAMDAFPPVSRDTVRMTNGEEIGGQESELMDEMGNVERLRSHFNDNAYWLPTLRTGPDGRAKAKVTFPDDLTSWDAYTVAMASRKRSGIAMNKVLAYKPLSGSLALPRFLVRGDTAMVIGKSMNYLASPQDIRSEFQVGTETVMSRTARLAHVLIDSLAVTSGATEDSLQITYRIKQNSGYGDGEQRWLRIVPRGMKDISGMYEVWQKDNRRTFVPESGKGMVTVHCSSDWKDFMLQETERLGKYQHLCNEQLASKLKGLLAEKALFAALQRPWSGEKLVAKLVTQLENRMEEHVGWGWWQGMPAEEWISLHAIEALLWAKDEGFKIRDERLDWVPSLVYGLNSSSMVSDRIRLLKMMQRIKPGFSLQSHIAGVDTLGRMSVGERIQWLEICQNEKMPVKLDSLRMTMRTSATGEQFWPSQNQEVWENDLLTTACAYRVMRNAGIKTDSLTGVLAYLLNARGAHGWGNTYLNAEILRCLVPDLGAGFLAQAPEIEVRQGTKVYKSKSTTHLVLDPTQPIEISQTGIGIVQVTAHQEFFTNETSAREGDFLVSSSFWQGGDEVKSLSAGIPATLKVRLEVKKLTEFVSLDIPIPAGCSYGPKKSGYMEVHREYFPEKVSSYFRKLVPGSYLVEVELQPRFGGRYFVNPTVAEHMYFPTIRGNGAGTEILLK